MTHSSNIWQKGDETPYFNGLLCHRINFKRYKPHTYFRWCQILKCQIYLWEYIHWTLPLNEPQHTGGPAETIWSPTLLPSSPDFPKLDGYIVSAVCYLSSNWIFALKSDKVWDGEDLEIHYNPWSGDQMRVLPSFSHLALIALQCLRASQMVRTMKMSLKIRNGDNFITLRDGTLYVWKSQASWDGQGIPFRGWLK